ncbi:MAG: HlyC/CorC family transporter [Acidobacteria bacterium]|nr:HlyC/CorC family transporter [Acidobacteriota bacterium]
MELSSTFGLAAVFLLVIANGFFVATEFAIVAVRRSRLEQLVNEGRAGAAAAKAVVGHLDAYIAATQFGITLASLALGWIGEPALAHLLEPPLTFVVGGFAPAAAHGVAIGVAFAIITGLHIVIGELAPKGLALQRPEITSLWVARPIQVFHAVFKWPITALNAVGNGTLKLFGLEPASGHEMVHSVEELRLLVTGMQNAGVVDDAEARIARRAFAFGDLTAASLMTPRTEIEAVPVSSTLEELLRIAETTRRNRLPVYEGSLDHVLGILHVRELFKHRTAPPHAFDLRSLIRPPMLAPETRFAAELLEDMRANRCHTAVVVDEYGGTAGMVTLRDLLEALVGRIDDTLSTEVNAPTEGTIEADGSLLLDGLMRVEEFAEAAGVRLVDESHESVDTVGGLFTAVLGRFPAIGEEITVEGRTLRVEARDGLRVSSVRLLPVAPGTGTVGIAAKQVKHPS